MDWANSKYIEGNVHQDFFAIRKDQKKDLRLERALRYIGLESEVKEWIQSFIDIHGSRYSYKCIYMCIYVHVLHPKAVSPLSFLISVSKHQSEGKCKIHPDILYQRNNWEMSKGPGSPWASQEI